MLNILCDVIHDVTDRAFGQFRKRLAYITAAKSGHIEQHFD